MGSGQYSVTLRDIMRVVSFIVFIGIIGGTIGGTRHTRDTEGCDPTEVMDEVKECNENAHHEYTTQWQKGSDGTKADFYARKSCNYITEVMECNGKLACFLDEEQLKQNQAEQFESVLKNVQENIPNWDSTKCPAAKAHIDGAAAEDEDPQPQPTGSATSVTVSILSTLVMAIFI